MSEVEGFEVEGFEVGAFEPAAFEVEGFEPAAFEVDVTAIAHGGHCVARGPDGRVVFVRHALPGERVRVVVTEERGSYRRGDAVEVLRPAPGRVEPPCRYAGPNRCGGCDFQHATPEAQRKLKAAVVVELLGRLGGLSPAEVDALGVRVSALPGGPLGWRTRVQYTVDAEDRAGLLKHRSHEVVPVLRCLIAHPGVQAGDATERRWPGADAVEVAVSAAGERSVLTRDRAGRLNVIEGPTVLRERAAGLEWTVPPDVFWQVHPAAADTLAAAVVELTRPRPGERAFDLYGGVGLFAAALAPHLGPSGRVDVVESDPRAVAAGRKAVHRLPQIHFTAAPVLRALRGPLRDARVDIVVLDPPRAGAGREVVTAIAERSPRAVVYVACDPAALARDVRTFRGLGWRLDRLEAYDLFPMTHHVECVALLARVQARAPY